VPAPISTLQWIPSWACRHPSSWAHALDLTIQSVVRKGVADSYAPQLTWGFLRLQATPEVVVRAGRMRTPFFMYSDSLNLNYATPWVRPPVEVYSLNPFADLNGVDALYRTPIGATDLELHVYGGKSSLDIRNGGGKLQAVRGVKAALSISSLTLQAGYARSNLSIHWGDPMFTALNNHLMATGNDAIARDLSGDDSKGTFLSAGFQYDSDRLLMIGEYARRTVDRYTVSAAGWYFTAGYRFNSLTPYITVARQIQTAPVTNAQSGIAPARRSAQPFQRDAQQVPKQPGAWRDGGMSPAMSPSRLNSSVSSRVREGLEYSPTTTSAMS
jgi:hypothetical protein